ncbi:MAG: hypothetical protein IJA37_01730, partial [Alistipes sp.]|nr:hypothetical protein [Alistipes sp.]
VFSRHYFIHAFLLLAKYLPTNVADRFISSVSIIKIAAIATPLGNFFYYFSLVSIFFAFLFVSAHNFSFIQIGI